MNENGFLHIRSFYGDSNPYILSKLLLCMVRLEKNDHVDYSLSCVNSFERKFLMAQFALYNYE